LDIREGLSKKLRKLKKKNTTQYDAIFKKAQEIQMEPHRYKNLNYPLNHLRRVHIDKHFVLVFSINEDSKTVILEDYDHHDNIY
jgi:YafQ family addiction module toxin component